MVSAFIAQTLPLACSSFTPIAISPRRPARRPSTPRPCIRAETDPAATPSPPPPTPDSTSTTPTVSSEAPKPEVHVPPTPATSTFLHKFDSMRGVDVEPVSAAMARFNTSFKRPVPIVYRAIVNEMISTTHLARVCAMWRFDAVFAFGFDSIFNILLRYYPDDNERTLLYNCAANALRLDPDVIRSTAAAVTDWIEGKTEKDILEALAAAPPGSTTEAVGPVIEALAFIRDSGEFDFYYSRLFGLGLIQIMSTVGVELTATNAENWADKFGLTKSKFASEMGNYLSNMERLKQAEQIFAEATAREAKKTADRLAEKAKRAADEAAALEKGEEPTAEKAASGDSEEKKEEDSA